MNRDVKEDNRMQIDNEGNGCSEMASDMRRRNIDSDKGNSILMNSSVCVCVCVCVCVRLMESATLNV